MTHYEVLGVDPGAGADEIRAAYRARARELHPDRRGFDAARSSDATAAHGGPEMAAVNQAWAVLGDPVRRAAYDAWLKDVDATGRTRATSTASPGATVPPETVPSGSVPSVGVPSRPPGYDEDHPPPVHAAMPGCFGSGALPWLLMVIILIVIFVFTAYAGPGDGDEPSGGSGSTESKDAATVPTRAVRDIRGMCIRVAGGITTPVDCLTLPNEGRIVAQAAIGASCPSGTTEWLVRQLDTLACTEPAAAGPP